MSVGKPSPGKLNAHLSSSSRMFKAAAAARLAGLAGMIYGCLPHCGSESSGTTGSGGKRRRRKKLMHFPGIISFTHHQHAGLPTSLLCAALPPCFSHHTTLLEPEWPHRKPFLFSLQVTTDYTSADGWHFFFPRASPFVI